MKMTTRQRTTAALMTALLAVLSQIAIPMPSGVPITLQTFAVALTGYMLGAKLGALAASLYVLLGALGLPIFSGARGGFSVMLGPTGGFIFGFIAMAALCGLSLTREKYGRAIGFSLLGLAACHLLGVLQFSIVTGNSLLRGAMVASVPYLIKDAISLIAAWYLARVIRRRVFRNAA